MTNICIVSQKQQLILDFAKEKKINKEELFELFAKVEKTKGSENVKSCQYSTLKARQDVIKALPGFVGKEFVLSELSSKVGIDAVTANNTARVLQRSGVLKVVGKKSVQGRGKPANLWMVNNKALGV